MSQVLHGICSENFKKSFDPNMLHWHVHQSSAHYINVDDLSISDKFDSQRNQISRTGVMELSELLYFVLFMLEHKYQS